MVETPSMTEEVTACNDCPGGITFHDEGCCGFDDCVTADEQPTTLPDNCPLREGPIVIRLRVPGAKS